MAPLRTNPTTALATLRHHLEALKRLVHDVGPIEGVKQLSGRLEQLHKEASGRGCWVELSFSPELDESDLAAIQPSLGWADPSQQTLLGLWGNAGAPNPPIAAGEDLRLSASLAGVRRIQRAGAAQAPVLVVVWPRSSTGPSQDQTAHLERSAQGRALTVLLSISTQNEPTQTVEPAQDVSSPTDSHQHQHSLAPATAPVADPASTATSATTMQPWQRSLLATLRQASLSVEQLQPPSETTVNSLLGSPTWKPLWNTLTASSLASAVEASAGVLRQLLSQEERGLVGKKALVQTQASQPATQLTAAQAPKLLAAVRDQLQREFGELERSLRDRLKSKLMPPTAPVWERSQQLLQELSNLQREERARTLATSIPADFEDRLLSELSDAITEACTADLVALQDLSQGLEEDIEARVTAAGGPPVTINIVQLTADRINRVASGSLHFQRTYRGELPRPGVFEYVMIARRSQMILFMMFSAFGLTALRSQAHLMVPMGVLLLAGGGVFAAQRVRRERVENLEKELQKAREQLSTEVKRQLNDVCRAWSGVLAEHLTTQAKDIVEQVDNTLRQFTASSAIEEAEGKQLLQSQLQGVESQNRRLAAPTRSLEQLERTLAQFRGELNQLMLGHCREQMQKAKIQKARAEASATGRPA